MVPCSRTTTSAPAAASGAGSAAPGQSAWTAAPTCDPSPAAAPRSSSETRCRPGSARTAITREAPRSKFGRSPGGGAAGPGCAVKAPRAWSNRTASATCASSGPSRTRKARACSRARVAPTSVGLPASPQGPGPSAPASTLVRRSGATAARPSGSTLQGSQRRSATERTAGSASSTSWAPSSCSSSRRQTEPRSSMRRTPLAKGRSSSSASSGPTCPVSPSMELRPSRTRSKGPAARRAAARARAVARVSEPAKAASQTCSPSSAPQATASRRTSSAPGGPSVTTVQEPPVSRANVTPWATARRQYGFISVATPLRTSRPSSSCSDSASGTCLAMEATRSGSPAARLARLTGSGGWPSGATRSVNGPARRRRGCGGPTPPPWCGRRRRPVRWR